jgi:Zn-dependent peptidase ImmA (M78 family)/DNA-binding XRE family transcriptional regulator
MSRKSFEVNVEPKVLRWARDTTGLNNEEVAKRLKVVPDAISRWETGEKKPTLVQLRKLSKVYKRPLAVFFLSVPPKEPPLPKDFRSLPENQDKPFSLKTRLAIRRARRLQSLAIELSKATERKFISHISKLNITDSVEQAASSIRKQLGIDIQTQFKWRNEAEAFVGWKKAIEKIGVFVFQMSMPLEETRGFSLTDWDIPVIVLNETDVIKAKIFSLFHEFAHILLNKGGLCDMEEDISPTGENTQIERFCNYFAGALLVPKTTLQDHDQVRSINKSIAWSDDVLIDIAKDFKVSKEVILRRLVIFDLATSEFYKKKREEWQLQAKELMKKKKKFGRSNPPKKCLQENGAPIISLVLDSYRKEKITYSDVADYLSIRLKHVPKVEHLLEGNA